MVVDLAMRQHPEASLENEYRLAQSPNCGMFEIFGFTYERAKRVACELLGLPPDCNPVDLDNPGSSDGAGQAPQPPEQEQPIIAPPPPPPPQHDPLCFGRHCMM